MLSRIETRSDDELLRAWTAGDAAAGELLVRRHFATVHRFLCNHVLESVADDLTQRSFEVALARATSFREGGSMRAFLLGIARLELLVHYRSLRREPTTIDEDGAVFADLATTPAEALVRGEGRRILARALRRLPLDLQIAVQLHYWEQLSSFEIAEVLAIPASTVRSRLQRARALLETLLADLECTPAERTESLATLDAWARRARVQTDEQGDSE